MRILLFVVLAFLFIGCNQIKGKIETRNDNLYLINTSTTKAYQFTIKETRKENDSIITTTTSLYKLSPGEEKFLSPKIEIKYPEIEENIPRMDTGTVKESFKVGNNEYAIPASKVNEFLKDFPNAVRVLEKNGTPLKISHEYIVTGQLEIKISPRF